MNKFNKISILNTFNRPDEKLLFSKVLDQAFLCTRDYTNKFTEFLNISICENFKKIIKDNYDINITLFGGVEGCERVKIGFSPEYYELSEKDFLIETLEIKLPKIYKNLTHRDFLGSIMGLGVERGQIGDILIFDTRAIIFASKDISEYICSNLKLVGKVGVETSIKQIDDLYMPLINYKDVKITVNSLRLCSIISASYNISRSKASDLVKSKKVFINWVQAFSTSTAIKDKDTITVRGYGRIYINKLLGKTSKDRFIINIQLYG